MTHSPLTPGVVGQVLPELGAAASELGAAAVGVAAVVGAAAVGAAAAEEVRVTEVLKLELGDLVEDADVLAMDPEEEDRVLLEDVFLSFLVLSLTSSPSRLRIADIAEELSITETGGSATAVMSLAFAVSGL